MYYVTLKQIYHVSLKVSKISKLLICHVFKLSFFHSFNILEQVENSINELPTIEVQILQ